MYFQVIESFRRGESVYNDESGGLDWDLLVARHGSVTMDLRTWRPGDEYQPAGRAGAEKIRVMFQESRTPSWERPNWPIVAVRNEIVWARRFGPASAYAVSSSTQRILVIDEQQSARERRWK